MSKQWAVGDLAINATLLRLESPNGHVLVIGASGTRGELENILSRHISCVDDLHA